MANYFCTDSVEEQVDLLTDKVKDLNTKKLDKAAIVQETGTGTDVVMSQKAVTDELSKKSNATNLANGTGGVLIQTTDTNHSFKVMTDGRAKVKTVPNESDDVVRKLELDGKLTKPTNPSAESAVTMLADGTVGTKPLSEIGGGKLYLHSMNFTNSYGIVNVIYYNTDSTPISITNNNIPSGRRLVGNMDGAQRGVVGVYIIKNDNSTYSASINGCVSSAMAETGIAFYNENITITNSNLTDTVTEV